MRHRQRPFLFYFLLSVVCALLIGQAPPAWAGAWTLPRERWYAEYFYRYFGSKKTFNSEGHSGRRPKTALFADIRNEWKLEYGVTDWFNLLASLPYISSHYRDDNLDLLRTGIGDIYVRTKFRATTTPLVSSVQFSWKIPGAYDPHKNPIGDGQFDFESRLLLSRSWTFAPYAESPRGSARPSPTHLSVGTQARSQAPVATRATAMRDAFMDAALHQTQARLVTQEEPGFLHPDDARAPFHEAVLDWFDDTLTPEAQAAPRSAPRLAMADRTTATETAPLTLANAPMDTRYAKVAFVNVEGGFTARVDDPANEFPILLEAGFTPLKRLMLVGLVESVLSVKSTHEETEDFAKWGVRAIVNVWGDGFATIFRTGGPTVNVEVGYNDVFAGRNTADAYELFGKIGVFF